MGLRPKPHQRTSSFGILLLLVIFLYLKCKTNRIPKDAVLWWDLGQSPEKCLQEALGKNGESGDTERKMVVYALGFGGYVLVCCGVR